MKITSVAIKFTRMCEHKSTAVLVVVAAIMLSAALHNHYSFPAELRELQAATRRIKNTLSEMEDKQSPLHNQEMNALLELADIDHELALAEADSLLLQSTLLEMIAAMSPEEKEAVPRKIKDMLSLVDVLTKETALALVTELDSAKARERSELSNTSMRQEDTFAAAPSPETLAQALAPAAKTRTRQEAAQQLDELVAHVTHWRSSARCVYVCVRARPRVCV